MARTPSPISPKRGSRAADSVRTQNAGKDNLVSGLGWTRKRAAQVRASLAAFEKDWDAPGMEEYDKL